VKRILPVLLLTLTLLLSGCYAGDWPDDVYLTNLTLEGPLVLTEDGLVWIELRPDLDFETVRANGMPTWVKQGIVGGWSLPPNEVGEELFMEIHAPNRWDEESDVYVHVHCYIDTANTDKNFNLELSWVYISEGDVVPNTSVVLTTQIGTGIAVQYTSYHVDFILDYDINSGDPLLSSDEIHIKLRRIDATVDEVAGEIVVTHTGIVFRRDKLGATEP